MRLKGEDLVDGLVVLALNGGAVDGLDPEMERIIRVKIVVSQLLPIKVMAVGKATFVVKKGQKRPL